MPEPKRTIKDSVFACLFAEPEKQLELYQSLHPEDAEVTEDDLRLVTLEHVLVNDQYNDLGLQVRDKLIFLVEAQSTFSGNIPLRMLFYMAGTYRDYVHENSLSLYQSKIEKIPRPELYMVYSGEKKPTPSELRLSDMYEGSGSIELTIKVLTEDGSGSIIDQYVRFCKIFNNQVAIYGRNQKAINETLRICREQNVLVSFLQVQEKEVIDAMTMLFDRNYEQDILKKNSHEEGRLEGQQAEREKSIRDMVTLIRDMAADKKVAVQKLMNILGLSQLTAQEKVDLYW